MRGLLFHHLHFLLKLCNVLGGASCVRSNMPGSIPLVSDAAIRWRKQCFSSSPTPTIFIFFAGFSGFLLCSDAKYSTIKLLSLTRLERKVALITGGAKGIGRSMARLFSNHGVKIVIADILDELGLSVCKDLKSPSIFVSCDVRKEVEVEEAVNAAVSEFKKLDIIFNNAGTVGKNSYNILDNELSDFLGTKHAARIMIPNPGGSIITTASVCSVMGAMASNAYTRSKHGIVGLMKNAAVELDQYGIRVNCVSPYAVATEMAIEATQSKVDFGRIYQNLKTGKALEVDDIAEAALFLASDESKYVSGHNLIVDGGFTALNRGLAFFGQP